MYDEALAFNYDYIQAASTEGACQIVRTFLLFSEQSII